MAVFAAFDNLDVVKILGYGVIGLSFLCSPFSRSGCSRKRCGRERTRG